MYNASSAATTGFSNPDRTLDTYAASIGQGSAASFLYASRQLSDQNWQEQLTAPAVNSYVQGGFW